MPTAAFPLQMVCSPHKVRRKASPEIKFAQCVSSWPLGRIKPSWRNKLGYTVRGHPDDPFLLVNLGVMKRTQQTTITVASGAEITFPEFDVMSVAPVRRPIASRPTTTLISGGDGPANMCGEGAGRPAHVEDF